MTRETVVPPQPRTGTNRAFILLGSNIEKEKNLPAAVRLLREHCSVIATSAVYESLAAGRVEQPNFLNAAVLLETELGAQRLKRDVLGQIEHELKRKRTSDRFAPRTIDADIVLFNRDVFDYDNHHVPDPDLLRFAHVAVPVAELAPEEPHPESGETIGAIAARLLAGATREVSAPSPLWKRSDVAL